MSAVIVPFPRVARAESERLRAVRERIIERAIETKASPELKAHALDLAMKELAKGASAGWAIYVGQRELPRSTRQAFRQPTDPRPAA